MDFSSPSYSLQSLTSSSTLIRYPHPTPLVGIEPTMIMIIVIIVAVPSSMSTEKEGSDRMSGQEEGFVYRNSWQGPAKDIHFALILWYTANIFPFL